MGLMLREEPPLFCYISATDLISAQKQYRDRIKKWGLNKNIQPDEMEAMIRKQQKRKLESNKRSTFRVRKRPVNPEKINQYIKEHPMQLIGENKDRNIDGNIGSAGMVPATSRLTCINSYMDV